MPVPRGEFTILDALGDAVAVVSGPPDWHVLFVNHAWERMLGAPRGGGDDASLWSAFPDLAKEPAGPMIRATADDGGTRRFDASFAGSGGVPAGRTFGIRVSRDGAGRVVIAAAAPFDIQRSTRDRALEEQHEENAALRQLARQTAEVEDTSTLLEILCNAASAQCGGQGATIVSVADHEGQLVSATGMLAPARGRRFPLLGSLAREVVANARPAMIEDFSASERPLAKRLEEVVIGPLIVAPLIAHDRVLGVLAVSRDRHAVPFSSRDAQRLAVVADHAALAVWKAQLLEQAQEADRAKGRFLATMSHELRTPLTALSGYEELLVDAVLGPLSDAQREVLDRMHHVTQHLSSIIEDVLAYTNLEAGGEVVRPTDFLAADLLLAVAAIVQPLAGEKGISVITESEATPTRMTSDVDKARQVLVNLATNAVKFTEQGDVRMSVRAADDHVHFAVTDTGIGISPDNLRLLFRPFTQLDSGLTRRHGGTGLGLYIADRVARLLGGRIDVESVPGRGSTFTLVLPRA